MGAAMPHGFQSGVFIIGDDLQRDFGAFDLVIQWNGLEVDFPPESRFGQPSSDAFGDFFYSHAGFEFFDTSVRELNACHVEVLVKSVVSASTNRGLVSR